jgi:hypothetical protein
MRLRVRFQYNEETGDVGCSSRRRRRGQHADYDIQGQHRTIAVVNSAQSSNRPHAQAGAGSVGFHPRHNRAVTATGTLRLAGPPHAAACYRRAGHRRRRPPRGAAMHREAAAVWESRSAGRGCPDPTEGASQNGGLAARFHLGAGGMAANWWANRPPGTGEPPAQPVNKPPASPRSPARLIGPL